MYTPESTNFQNSIHITPTDYPKTQVTVDKDTGLLQLKVNDEVVQSYKISIMKGTEKVSLSDDDLKKVAAKVAYVFNQSLIKENPEITDLSKYKISGQEITETSIGGKDTVKTKMSQRDASELNSIVNTALKRHQSIIEATRNQKVAQSTNEKDLTPEYKQKTQEEIKSYRDKIRSYSKLVKENTPEAQTLKSMSKVIDELQNVMGISNVKPEYVHELKDKITDLANQFDDLQKINQSEVISIEKKDLTPEYKQKTQEEIKSYRDKIRSFSKLVKENTPEAQILKSMSKVVNELQNVMGISNVKPEYVHELKDKITDLANKFDDLQKINQGEVINTEKVETLKTEISTTLQEVQVEITAVKTDAVTKEEFKHLASGKAKDVWSSSVQPGKVFFTPVQGLFEPTVHSKENEIREEVQTGNAIKTSLLKEGLTDLIKAKGNFNDQVVAYIVGALLKNYDNLEDCIHDLNSKANIAGLNSDTVSTLKSIFTNNPKEMKELKEVGSNINLDQKILTGDQRVKIGDKALFTVENQKADGDFEKILTPSDDIEKNEIRSKLVAFPKMTGLVGQFLKGMTDMHKAGYVHGDMKRENLLAYGTSTDDVKLKIADFGKTTKLDESSVKMSSGNPRTGRPHEGLLSQKGEVCSAGFLMIEMLEEAFLSKDTNMLIQLKPNERDSTVTVDKKRRGFEAFLILNKNCPQTESKTSKGKVRVLLERVVSKVVPKSLGDLKKSEVEVHRYIDALTAKLEESNKGKEDQIHDLGRLLKIMTRANPKERPTMEKALEIYSSIMEEMKGPSPTSTKNPIGG